MVSKTTVGSLIVCFAVVLGALGGCSAGEATTPADGIGGQGGGPSGGSSTGGAATGGGATGGTMGTTGGATTGGTAGGATTGGAAGTTGGTATGGVSGAAGSSAGTAGLGGASGGAGGLGGASGAAATGATGGVGGVGGASGSAGVAGSGGGPSCVAGRIPCGALCVDATSDPANCGTCGTVCSGGRSCSSGTCACPTGQAFCSNACVNTMTSATNCGACGTTCSGGRSCSSGTCVCPTGQTFCSNACINTQTDVNNCGGCGTRCTTGQACTNGSCTGGGTTTGVIGWAAVSGNGVTTTTGGSTSNTVDVNSPSALSSAASSGTSQVIRLTASVSVSSLNVASNKTIIGVGSNIVISGGIEINNRQNVILQNFRVNAASSGVSAGDGIRITNSHHVWIDHLEVYDAPDGNLDITDRANFITVSWTKFRYSTNSGDHRYSNLIGAGDNETGDENLLNVTWHHNWWAQNVHERMPRVRFGDVHVFNNYYSSSGNNYCIRAGFHSNVLIENNHFQGVDTPHELGEDQGTAIVTARGNLYSSTTGAQGTRGTAFTPPYQYTLDAASSVSSAVQSGAGPH